MRLTGSILLLYKAKTVTIQENTAMLLCVITIGIALLFCRTTLPSVMKRKLLSGTE